MLTGQEVVNAVSRNLRNHFSESTLPYIYKNKALQDMQFPCAFIHQVNKEFVPEMRNRGEQRFIIDVRFHPTRKSTDFETWAQFISEECIDVLEYLVIENQMVRVRGIESRTETGVLHVIATYSFKVKKRPKEGPEMREYELTGHVTIQ